MDARLWVFSLLASCLHLRDQKFLSSTVVLATQVLKLGTMVVSAYTGLEHAQEALYCQYWYHY